MTMFTADQNKMFGCSDLRIIPIIDAAVLVVSICIALLRVKILQIV